MPTYEFSICAKISMSTRVEADSLEEAMQNATERDPIQLCFSCSEGDPEEEWVTSGELDFAPDMAELLSVHIDDRVYAKDLGDAEDRREFEEIDKQWKNE